MRSIVTLFTVFASLAAISASAPIAAPDSISILSPDISSANDDGNGDGNGNSVGSGDSAGNNGE